MKALMVIFSFVVSAQAFAGNGMLSAAQVQKALANPHQYSFDDGGNISFGNGYWVRRFNFAGKAQVCHAGNYLYAGVRNKCVKPITNGDEVTGCAGYAKVELKTPMNGTAQVCTDNHDDHGGPCQKYSTVKFNKGPQVKVAVYRKSQMNSDHDQAGLLGYTYLTIPACND